MNRKPLTHPVPWRGEELAAHPGWLYRLSDADLGEIDNALQGAMTLPWDALSPANFPLRDLAEALRYIRVELEDGTGIAKLVGLPVERYSDRELRTIYLGLSAHLGTPTDQNGARGMLRDIHDRSADGGKRVDSADALNWHNDRTDIVGLLCVREAASGGISKLASMTAIHNAMLEHCPDLLEILFQDFNRFTPGDEVGGSAGCHALPVLHMDGRRLSTHFSRTYIDQAACLPGVGPLSAHQSAALDALIAIADECAFHMTLACGEIQFLNNHAILHARTAFTDDASRGAQRLLLRVWLSTHAGSMWTS
jgi:hypothetical protein